MSSDRAWPWNQWAAAGSRVKARQKLHPLHLTASRLPAISLRGFDFQWVARSMVGDLETQEVVDCGPRDRIIGCNRHARPGVDGLVPELNLLFQ